MLFLIFVDFDLEKEADVVRDSVVGRIRTTAEVERLKPQLPDRLRVVVRVLGNEAFATFVDQQDLRAHRRKVFVVVPYKAARDHSLCHERVIRPLDYAERLKLISQHECVQILGVVFHKFVEELGRAAQLHCIRISLFLEKQLEEFFATARHLRPIVDATIRHPVSLLHLHGNWLSHIYVRPVDPVFVLVPEEVSKFASLGFVLLEQVPEEQVKASISIAAHALYE